MGCKECQQTQEAEVALKQPYRIGESFFTPSDFVQGTDA
jgi:hypothetical protein